MSLARLFADRHGHRTMVNDANPKTFTLDERASGVLLHPTSLPGPHGNGDLGPEAVAFAEFLADGAQGWWQMLPVNPTGDGNSPYSGASASAGNAMLISIDRLVDDGLLQRADLGAALPTDRVDYARAEAHRSALLRRAFEAFRSGRGLEREDVQRFVDDSRAWLDDYALYVALRARAGGASWSEWPAPVRTRDPDALARAREELRDELDYVVFEQFTFDEHWRKLRAACAARGIGLIGDAPIFVAHDSSDVWAHARLFRIGEDGRSTHVAGVPPDYFSKTGQRWGNPLYRWKRLARTGYRWWIDRFRALVRRFDVIRLDHFIGFARYWEIDAREKTAEHGRYMKGPGRDLFRAAERELGRLPFIAEDLGAVTPSVRRLRDELGLPGMRVLQFAFGTDVQADDFRPHNFTPRTVAYTGTHDNDTILGWYDDDGKSGGPRSPEQAENERAIARHYLTGSVDGALGAQPQWDFIRLLMMSVANTTIFPLQDLLGLGNDARMNAPGRAEGNWGWRLSSGAAEPELARRLRDLTETYGRVRRGCTSR